MNAVKPSISSHSKPCPRSRTRYKVSHMFCFRVQCIQNKTFETPRTRLLMTKNTGFENKQILAKEDTGKLFVMNILW